MKEPRRQVVWKTFSVSMDNLGSLPLRLYHGPFENKVGKKRWKQRAKNLTGNLSISYNDSQSTAEDFNSTWNSQRNLICQRLESWQRYWLSTLLSQDSGNGTSLWSSQTTQASVGPPKVDGEFQWECADPLHIKEKRGIFIHPTITRCIKNFYADPFTTRDH